MDSDFDHDPDFELEDFDGLHQFSDDDGTVDVMMRTAVLKKNHMVALLCIKSADEGAAICRVDPREEHPAVQIYDDPAKALEWFRKSLKTSLSNGWQVVYDGLPLQG
jgi:hypothetical protein